MPGTNLTREEAQQRARLLTVDAYEIELDLSGAQEGGTFRSVTTVRFDSAEAGASTFIDLVAPTVHEVVLNGDALDPAEVFEDCRIALPALLAGATSCGSSPTARTPTPARVCTASSTRSTSRPTSTPSSRCRTRAGSSPASSSPT